MKYISVIFKLKNYPVEILSPSYPPELNLLTRTLCLDPLYKKMDDFWARSLFFPPSLAEIDPVVNRQANIKIDKNMKWKAQILADQTSREQRRWRFFLHEWTHLLTTNVCVCVCVLCTSVFLLSDDNLINNFQDFRQSTVSFVFKVLHKLLLPIRLIILHCAVRL